MSGSRSASRPDRADLMLTPKLSEQRPKSVNAWEFIPQRTLKAPIHCAGIGLHSGRKVKVALQPADPDTGITIVRTDIRGFKPIPARWDYVADTRLCTVLANQDHDLVGTVEHLMAAFAGLGIDNAVVEVDGPELPIMDGSSEPFVFLIDCAGTIEQARPRRAIRILSPVTVGGDTWQASLLPASSFELHLEIEFDSRAIPRQCLQLAFGDDTFKEELAAARTFGFLKEVEQMRAAGLARGGSLDNAIVVDGGKVINEEGLRFADEFVRHKALDAVGDLFLAGAPIIGRFQGTCTGHAANNQLVSALFANEHAWSWDILRPTDRWFSVFDPSTRLAALARSA